jgi:hypothetical protein
VQGVKAYLTVPGTRTQFQTATSNEKGLLKFEMKNFYSEGDIVVQTNSNTSNAYRIDVEGPFVTTPALPSFSPMVVSRKQPAILEGYLASQVQNAYSGEQLNRSLLKQWDTSSFYGKADVTYLLDNYVRFTTMEEVLREYVLEINVRQRNGRFHLPVFDEVDRAPFSGDPMVLLDGLPIFNFNRLMSYDPLKVRKLEIVTRKYYLGEDSFDGIASFTTYKGDAGGYELDPSATVLDYEGLQLQREFYSPAYENPEQVNSRLPDFRTLLYWAPDLKTDASGKQALSFYSSDLPGRYAIIVQGISSDGRSGSKVSYFDVRK